MKASENQCMDKVIKTVKSCTTYKQWLAAWNMIDNFHRIFKDNEKLCFLYDLHDLHLKQITE